MESKVIKIIHRLYHVSLYPFILFLCLKTSNSKQGIASTGTVKVALDEREKY